MALTHDELYSLIDEYADSQEMADGVRELLDGWPELVSIISSDNGATELLQEVRRHRDITRLPSGMMLRLIGMDPDCN